MDLPAAFGKYHLLERLAIGGMAEVFLAKSFGAAGFERILVIKKILPHMSEDEEFITMFIDEARIASSLSHSNIIQITELGKEGSDYYIAMEYVMGKDLSRIYEKISSLKETMPISLAVLIATRICEGLEYAHRKKDSTGKSLNIIHRDVSPGNIIVSYDGDIKIIDFGIAKAQMRMGRTSAGTLKGKFGYMSPEQVRGKRLDHRSDIFSVGILLYEMLTGERLFGSQSDFGTLEKVRNAIVAPPSTFNSKIPDELEKVVMKALAREPQERYEWASDMQEALMRFLMNEGTLTTSKSLSLFMKETFTKELMLENRKMAVYRKRGYPWVDAAKGEDPKEALEPLKSQDSADAVPKTTIDQDPQDGAILTPSKENISEEATQIFYSNPSIPLQTEDPWENEPVEHQQAESPDDDPRSDPRVNQPTIIFDEEELSGETVSLDDLDSYEGEETAEVDDFDESAFPREDETEREGKPLEDGRVPVLAPDEERRRKQEAARRRLRGELSNPRANTSGTEFMAGRKGRAGPLPNRPETSRPRPRPVPPSSRSKQASTIQLVIIAAAVGLITSGILGYLLFFKDHPNQSQANKVSHVIVPEPLKPPEHVAPASNNTKDTATNDSKKSAKQPPSDQTPASDTKSTKKQADTKEVAHEDLATKAEHNDDASQAEHNDDATAPKHNDTPAEPKRQEKKDKPKNEENTKEQVSSADRVLIIQSSPPGAKILINGKPKGTTPNSILKMDASKSILVTLEKRGYKKFNRKIEAGTQGTIDIQARLVRLSRHKSKKRSHKKSRPKGSGWLVANTNPWAKVIIDGRDTGLWTPVVGKNKIKLRAGKHILVFKTKDGRKTRLKITIHANKTTKVIKKNL